MNRLKILDFRSGDINEFILELISKEEIEDVCIISSRNNDIRTDKLFESGKGLMTYVLDEMDEEDVEDCINCIVIMDTIDEDSDKVYKITSNSEVTYAIMDFSKEVLTPKQVACIYEVFEMEETHNINDDLLEIIQVIKEGKYFSGINQAVYYEEDHSQNEEASKKEEVSAIEQKSISQIEEDQVTISQQMSVVNEDLRVKDEQVNKKQSGTGKSSVKLDYEPNGEDSREVQIGKRIVKVKRYKDSEKLFVDEKGQVYQEKSKVKALLLCIFLGLLGADKFYLKRPVRGIIFLLTAGLFVFGWIYSIISLISLHNNVYVKCFKDANYNQDANKTKVQKRSIERDLDCTMPKEGVPYVWVTDFAGLYKIVDLAAAHEGISSGKYPQQKLEESIQLDKTISLEELESNYNFKVKKCMFAKGLNNTEIEIDEKVTIILLAICEFEDYIQLNFKLKVDIPENYYLPSSNIELELDEVKIEEIEFGSEKSSDSDDTIKVFNIRYEKLNLSEVRELKVSIKNGYSTKEYVEKKFEVKIAL